MYFVMKMWTKSRLLPNIIKRHELWSQTDKDQILTLHI